MPASSKQRSIRMKWTAEKIKQLRRDLGETQEQFARHFRVSIDAVQHWEQGRGPITGPVSVILDQLEDSKKPAA